MKTKRLETTNHCAACGMLVGDYATFHPDLYCELFKLGVKNPANFLKGQHFIPDPAHWGKGAPKKQVQAAAARMPLSA